MLLSLLTMTSPDVEPASLQALAAALLSAAWSQVRISSSFPDARSHTLAVWEGFGVRFGGKMSHHYETKKLAQATHRTVASPEPDTMVMPSSLTATQNTSPV